MVILQKKSRQSRRQGQRVDRGNDSRDGDRQRELAIELTRQAGDEGKRNEDRDQNQRNRDDRTRHFAHRLVCRLAGT
ncbi:hypothetical protein D3C87_1704920 [compost metagenome]